MRVCGGEGVGEAAKALDCVSPIIFLSRCLSPSSSPFRGGRGKKKTKRGGRPPGRGHCCGLPAEVFKVRRLDAPDKEAAKERNQ